MLSETQVLHTFAGPLAAAPYTVGQERTMTVNLP